MRKLHSWIDGYLEYTETTEPSYNYRLWSAISGIATALERKVVFKLGFERFYPNMYIILVGPAGKARKTTAMKPMSYLLTASGLPINIAPQTTTREGLITALYNAGFNDEDETLPLTNHSLTVFAEELVVFLGYQNHQLIADLCDWYDCKDTWVYFTKGEEARQYLSNLWVNILGGTTPELLQSLIGRSDAIGGGLASRMILVYEEGKAKSEPFPVLTAEQEQIGRMLVHDLREINKLSGEYKYDKEFRDLYTAWYMNNDVAPPVIKDPRFQGYLSRRQTHLLKLTCILNASRTDKMILEAEDFNLALRYLEGVEEKMHMTFYGAGAKNNSEVTNRVRLAIKASGVEGISYKLLSKAFRYDLYERELKLILGSFNATDEIVMKKTDDGKDALIMWIGD